MYTNSGLENNEEGIELLKTTEYFNYISDTDSPPFSILWKIIPFILLSKTNGVELKDDTFMKNLQYHCSDYTKQHKPEHLPYDRVLSEVWSECIQEEQFVNVRIEFGQNNGRVQQIEADHVFFKHEFPIFLARVAKYNLDLKELHEKEERLERTLITLENSIKTSNHLLKNPQSQKLPIRFGADSPICFVSITDLLDEVVKKTEKKNEEIRKQNSQSAIQQLTCEESLSAIINYIKIKRTNGKNTSDDRKNGTTSRFEQGQGADDSLTSSDSQQPGINTPQTHKDKSESSFSSLTGIETGEKPPLSPTELKGNPEGQQNEQRKSQ